jgi:hypothetical protein
VSVRTLPEPVAGSKRWTVACTEPG